MKIVLYKILLFIVVYMFQGVAMSEQNQNMITVYDEFGRELLIEKETWRTDVLPGNLENAWNNPDELYTVIVSALNDGFFNDVLKASKQLSLIDNNKERAYTVYAIILMKTGDLPESEKMLKEYIQKYGKSGIILTNLAKVYAEKGDRADSEKTLRESLSLDPNQDNALEWFMALQNEKYGSEIMYNELKELAKLQGSWRPRLWLARRELENQSKEKAIQHYKKILQVASEQSDVLMMISGDLGNNGHIQEIIDIIAPIYMPQQHGAGAGINLLNAHVQAKDYKSGMALLNKLYLQHWPHVKEHLDYYSNELDKIKSGNVSDKSVDEELNISSHDISGPIWLYGLGNPEWLHPNKDGNAKKVIFLPLAVMQQEKSDKVTEQRENEIGRLSRSIPLYFSEAMYFWSDLKSSTLIFRANNSGPVVFGQEQTDDALFNMEEHGDYIVSGAIVEKNDGYIIKLKLLDLKGKKVINRYEKNAQDKDIGKIILELEKTLLSELSSGFFPVFKPKVDYYSRPKKQYIDEYLVGLGQALVFVFAANKLTSHESLWGERNILDWNLSLALTEPVSLNNALIFYSSLRNDKHFGSDIYKSYKDKAFKLLEKLKDDSLKPLLFDIYDMDSELKSLSKTGQGEKYDEWFNKLASDSSDQN